MRESPMAAIMQANARDNKGVGGSSTPSNPRPVDEREDKGSGGSVASPAGNVHLVLEPDSLHGLVNLSALSDLTPDQSFI